VSWRKRIGEGGVEWLLTETIEAAKRRGTIKATSLSTIVVDTTLQPKAIAHPTDSRLLNRAREQLAEEAKANGIELRQSYARVGHACRAAGGALRAREAISADARTASKAAGLARSRDSRHRAQDP
jgi:IS5 family transposase